MQLIFLSIVFFFVNSTDERGPRISISVIYLCAHNLKTSLVWTKKVHYIKGSTTPSESVVAEAYLYFFPKQATH